jgi:hypothetical protein
MPLWRPTHQFTKSLSDFLSKMPGLIIGITGSPPSVPRVPLVIRIGASGPLDLHGEGKDLALAVNAILTALKRYADESANPRFQQRMFADGALSPAELRLSCQLAAGFDQMVASAALAIGCKLHIVLPGSRAAFRHDIARNLPGETQAVLYETRPGLVLFGVSTDTQDPVSQLEQLLRGADRVLELDRDDESDDQSLFTRSDYAQAGSVILDHSDVVLVAVHDEPFPPFLGSTRWIEQRVEERDLILIRIPVEQPFAAELIWTVDDRREQRRLFVAGSHEIDSHVFVAALDDRLLGPPFALPRTRLGWFERRMAAQLDPEYNAREWDKRWTLASSDALAQRDLGSALRQIDHDLKPVKVWADHRASAMAELGRGAFIVSALLGVLAVLGALIGIIFPVPFLVYGGKVVEIGCLGAILWFVRRSRRYDWRSQWLSLRQLERFVEQAAWLLLLGRGLVYATPSHLAQFQKDDVAKWTNTYFRALIRNSSLPNACFTPDYLKTVHALALQNLVVDQISYLREEALFQHKSDEVLERWIKTCVLIAGVVTFAYLLAVLARQFLPTPLGMEPLSGETAGHVVAVFAALLTSAAAALSAMRNHGEYAQIAARFEGASGGLEGIRSKLAARLPNRRLDPPPRPLRSASLASIVRAATDILIQEVQGWRAILQKKEIEPT